MKLIFPVVLIATIVFLTNCSKSSEPTRVINCDGLITDTMGTGDNGRVYIPNAFSPNNDGLNEIFRPVTQNIASIVFTIYDENNVVIFTTAVLGYGWQPSLQASNVAKKYYYKIQATTAANKKIGLCGEFYSLTCFPVNPPRSFYYFEDMLTPNGFTGVTNESLPTCY